MAEKGDKINLGAFGNFNTGGEAKDSLLALPRKYQHPRGRILVGDTDIADTLAEKGQDYLQGVRYYAGENEESESKEEQNEVDEKKGIGIIWCSYILGYALNLPYIRGIKKVITYKKKDEEGKEYEIETERLLTVKGDKNVQMNFVAGTKIMAPKLTKTERKKGEKVETEMYPVTQLSFSTPNPLIDIKGEYVRVSQKKKKDEDGKEIPIGLGITENYMEEWIAATPLIETVIASFRILTATIANKMKPDFEIKDAKFEAPKSLLASNLVDTQIIYPPSKTVWTGTLPGVEVGVKEKDRIVPMRVPKQEFQLLFEDLL